VLDLVKAISTKTMKCLEIYLGIFQEFSVGNAKSNGGK